MPTEQIEVELATLRREVSELRLGLQNLETAGRKSDNDAYWDPVAERMRAEMEKENKPGVIGVLRAVILLQSSGGNNVWGSDHQFGSVAKLPPVEALIALCNALSNSTALQAMYQMFKRHFDGQEMTLTKAELAGTLSVTEADMEQALAPLVANQTLRWSKNADGSEFYRFERVDLFATLLTLA
jgi:hypothetical protein